MAKVTFHPQAWANDYAIDVDPEGPTEFKVSDAEVAGMKDNSYESDTLRAHANAPDWMAAWSGPFYISIETFGRAIAEREEELRFFPSDEGR